MMYILMKKHRKDFRVHYTIVARSDDIKSMAKLVKDKVERGTSLHDLMIVKEIDFTYSVTIDIPGEYKDETSKDL